MADGDAAMREMIARLRGLEELVPAVAPDVARALEQELLANIAREAAPDGTPWLPTQSGAPALTGAGKALSISAVGTTVVAQIDGVEARHHLGRVRGGIARPILPGAGVPAPLARAIGAALDRRVRAIAGGR